MWPFSKKNVNNNRVDLYVPETMHNDRFSKWRKPEQAYLNDPEAKRRQLQLTTFILKVSGMLNMLLALVVMVGIVKLLLFTDYERVVFDDDTYLTCIVEPDGTISTSY